MTRSPRPLDVRAIVSLVALAVATTAAAAGFRAVFVDWSFLPSALVGAAAATVVIGVAWSRRLLIGETLALSVAAFVVVGIVTIGGLDPATGARELFGGLRGGWAELLSLTPPIDPTTELRVLPFTLTWLGATVGSELLRRSNNAALPSLGPLLTLSLSVLVTAEDRTIALVQGAAIAAAALVVGVVVRTDRTGLPAADVAVGLDDDEERRHRRTRRAVGAAGGILCVAVAAPLLGPRLPLVEAHDRFDLRDRSVPPWDPLEIPSPLVQLKSSLREEQREDVMFTVRSEDRPTRWNLAVLGAYDGVVWTVGSGDGRDAAQEFRPVGSRLPDPPDAPARVNEVTATVTIDGLRGPWLPAAGWAEAIRFDPAGADEPSEQLRMNLTTGTLAVPTGVEAGVSYDATFEQTLAPPDDVLLGARPSGGQAVVDVEVIPPPIRNLAADVLEGVDPGWEQALAIRSAFVDDGFYDVSVASRPGHSYFRLAEFLAEPERLVGFEEQYAAAAATIARIAQLPTRVVVGYVISDSRYDVADVAVIRAGDVSAWIEIGVADVGWVPLDVTPERSREPVSEATGVTIEEVAVPSPPPPPEIPPDLDVFAGEDVDDEDEEDEDERDEDDAGSDAGLDGRALVVIGGVGALAALLLVLVAVAAWKARRRRRRRELPDHAARIGFAWREVLDRCEEAGVSVDERATPAETARRLVVGTAPAPPPIDLDDAASGELQGLVRLVDRAAYHADLPEPADGDAAWTYADGVATAIYASRSRLERLRMQVDPRTLPERRWRRSGSDMTRTDATTDRSGERDDAGVSAS